MPRLFSNEKARLGGGLLEDGCVEDGCATRSAAIVLGLPALTAAATTAPATTAAVTAAAATTTAAAAAAVAATAAAASTTSEPATTATAAAAILGLLHRDLASLDVAAVDLVDGLLGLVIGRHLDEAEATRAAGLAIGDDLGIGDGAERGEQLAQIQLGDAVGQISNVESRSHFFLVCFSSDRRSCRLQNPQTFRSPKAVPATIAGGDDEDGDEGVPKKLACLPQAAANSFSSPGRARPYAMAPHNPRSPPPGRAFQDGALG